jgi:hypothetical protein
MKKTLPPMRGETPRLVAGRTGCERIAAESATREESGFVHDDLLGVLWNFRHI